MSRRPDTHDTCICSCCCSSQESPLCFFWEASARHFYTDQSQGEKNAKESGTTKTLKSGVKEPVLSFMHNKDTCTCTCACSDSLSNSPVRSDVCDPIMSPMYTDVMRVSLKGGQDQAPSATNVNWSNCGAFFAKVAVRNLKKSFVTPYPCPIHRYRFGDWSPLSAIHHLVIPSRSGASSRHPLSGCGASSLSSLSSNAFRYKSLRVRSSPHNSIHSHTLPPIVPQLATLSYTFPTPQSPTQ